ncbi:hypothetical protein MIR68_010244 [Amoeboaphelidium protococcarum]|nr:hypothetical protein MIR68_010244 [Amoeboaphelidium protococcarum]
MEQQQLGWKNRLNKIFFMSEEEHLEYERLQDPDTFDIDESGEGGSSRNNIRGRSWRSFFKFIGPAYMIAVGFIDPGNWASDISAGASYGYRLLFVVLMSSLIGLLFQVLCCKLGIVTGRDLAEQCRRVFHKDDWLMGRVLNRFLYILTELAIIATDLAEVIGSALALYLLLGIPIVWGILITGLDVIIILKWWGQKYQKVYEIIILVILLIVGVCFVILLTYTKPSFVEIMEGFIPRVDLLFKDNGMLYIAVAILGATVMPHNLYLHTSICRTRRIDMSDNEQSEDGNGRIHVVDNKNQKVDEVVPSKMLSGGQVLDKKYEIEVMDEQYSDSGNTRHADQEYGCTVNKMSWWQNSLKSKQYSLRYAAIDTVIALTFAFVINATILIVGSSAFNKRGMYDVAEIQDAYHLLEEYVGKIAAVAFGIALLASGQSSTITGTLAGQIVMNGFLNLRLRLVFRRLGTRLLAIIPALVIALIGGNDGAEKLLVLSQVILSIQLPFAVLPLVIFTSSRQIMGGSDRLSSSSSGSVVGKYSNTTGEGQALLSGSNLNGDDLNGSEKFTNGWPLTILAWLCTILVIGLNVNLIVGAAAAS